MASFMRPFESQVYATFRVVTGLLFLWYGTQKLFGFPQPMPMDPGPFITYVAGGIELIGGILVMIGLFTSWAAFICSGEMAVAYWMGHRLGLNGPFSIFPSGNHRDLPILYCFAVLFITPPWSASEAVLRDFFSTVGEVHSVAVITDRETGRSRGFGFVEMDDGDADKAINQLNGRDMNGRPLRVNEAQDRRRGGGGGGGGGGRDRDGGGRGRW